MPKILVVEDDPVLAHGLRLILQLEGYKVIVVDNLNKAYKMADKKILLVILDINLPDGSGFEFIEKTRKADPKLPIIILTAKTDEDSVVYGLQRGANDYVRKPFGNRELIARIKAILKNFPSLVNKLTYGNLELFPEQREVSYLGKKIILNRRGFDILKHFIARADVIITRESLLKNIDRADEIFDRTIDSHISHLRAAFKAAGINDIKISSVYGIGYRLEKHDS